MRKDRYMSKDNRNLKLKEWVSLAEIIGSIAVVASMIFLIGEVRNNTEATQRSNMIQLTTSPLTIYLNNPNIQDVIQKASVTKEALTTETVRRIQDEFELTFQEATLYARYIGYNWRIRESEFLYGNTVPTLFRKNIEFHLRRKIERIYWETNTVPYHSEFKDYIQDVLSSM